MVSQLSCCLLVNNSDLLSRKTFGFKHNLYSNNMLFILSGYAADDNCCISVILQSRPDIIGKV